MANNRNSTLAGALFLVAGGIIGAGVALLFAPQSGKATRKDIARCAKRAKRKAEDIVEDFSDNISKMVDVAGERAEDILETGKDLAYEAKRDLLRAFEKGQEKLEKQRAKLSKMIG
jgi:gas vesicle protein